MTAQQLKEQFLIRFDAISNFASPGYEDSEISVLLTIGQMNILRKVILTGDRTEVEKKVISKLITPYSITSFSTDALNMTNGYWITIPDDHFVFWEEHALIGSGEIGTLLPVQVKPVTYDRYIIDINNPFACPYSKLVWRLDSLGKHELITDGSTLRKYIFRYVRLPKDINITNNVTSELADAFHDTVVEAAVQEAIRSIVRTQGNQQPQQNNQQAQNQDG